MPATSLDSLLAAFALSPHEVQVFDPAHPAFDAQRPLLVLGQQFDEAAPVIAERYPATHSARGASAGNVADAAVGSLPASADAWLIAALPAELDARAFAGLRAVMERLYGPDGCPWDREQTHESLRRYTLEETYELVDAIDRGDVGEMREELGDLLAHILMHTSIAQESGEFRLEDAIESSVTKMVRRHPHVFANEQYESTDALLDRWDEIKAEERGTKGEPAEEAPGALDSVPAAAPALMRSQALIARALRAGLGAPAGNARGRLLDAVDSLSDEPTDVEIGALLWHAVEVAREADVDAEEALREVAGRFAAGFGAVEASARADGRSVADLEETDHAAPWRAATEG
jgi:MazG family protein